MTTFPSARAGRITPLTSSARAAANSSASPCGLSSTVWSLRISRIRSPTSVPPGSRTAMASSPSAWRSRSAWVVLPERSIPSKVTNSPRIRGDRSKRRGGLRLESSAAMRTLVTGGAGFIGSNLVDALLERGDEVAVIDDLSTGRRENLAQAADAALHELDIRDYDAVADVVGRTRPEVVFHLAPQIDVRKSVADPAYDAGINVQGTINLLRASLDAGVGRFVNTSTGGAIYGENQIVPAPESHPVAPKAPYGQSKFCAEGYAGLFSRLHDLSTVSLRYGNVYG